MHSLEEGFSMVALGFFAAGAIACWVALRYLFPPLKDPWVHDDRAHEDEL
jgi:hypothetical protein